MKASVNKITDGAKRRDTLGRNNVEILVAATAVGSVLWTISLNNSQTSGVKQTPVIVRDPNGSLYLLYYNIAKINDTSHLFDDIVDPNSTNIDLANLAHGVKEESAND